MDTEGQIEAVNVVLWMPIEAQAYWLAVGVTAGMLFCVPVVMTLLIRRAQKAGEGVLND